MARLTEYTDEQRANGLAVLASTGGNMKKAATLLGISRTTLRGWAKQNGFKGSQPRSPEPAAIVGQVQKLADRFEQVANRAVDESIDEAIARSSAKDRLVVAGIATDKMQLLRGLATSRQESLQVTLVAGGSLRELASVVLGQLESSTPKR